MSNVGYATLPVIPSVRGIGSAVAQQISAPLARESSAAGQTAGNNIKNGILGVARTIAGPLLAYAGFSALKSGISSAIDAASDLGEAGTASDRRSAAQTVAAEAGVPVIAVANLHDLLAFAGESAELVTHRDRLLAYRASYGSGASN